MKRTLSKTLGPISAQFINRLLMNGKTIFTLDDAVVVYGKERKKATQFLSDLVKRGILTRIKAGVYLILQAGQINSQLDNWAIIARALAGSADYYISYYSAMRLHGMTTHATREVTITLSKRCARKTLHHIVYRFIYIKSTHFWGHCAHWVTKQEKVFVSDIERTLLDALERPDLCIGIPEIVRGLWVKQKEIDWRKLVRYSKKFHTIAAVKRLGFILELLGLGVQCIPSLLKITTPAKDYIFLDPNEPKTGRYVSRWRVRLNVNADALKASVWG